MVVYIIQNESNKVVGVFTTMGLCMRTIRTTYSSLNVSFSIQDEIVHGYDIRTVQLSGDKEDKYTIVAMPVLEHIDHL